MPTNISRIKINAPLQQVWDTLTRPELLKQWQFGSDLITDWKVGSSIRFRTEWEGKMFEQWGNILELIPGKSIKYSLFAPRPDLEDKPENYFTMHYELTEADGATLLKIAQEDNRPGATQEREQGEENPILQSLKTLAETL